LRKQRAYKLYWSIGKDIVEKLKHEGWGAKIIDRLSHDLSITFPGISGFSTRNLKYMRKFTSIYKDFIFVQQVAAQIPWWHHVVLMDKISNSNERRLFAGIYCFLNSPFKLSPFSIT
jgi:hypothetical protein